VTCHSPNPMNGELLSKRKALETLWQQGTSGHKLLRQQALLIDTFISRHFSTARSRQGIALVALGGYGRQEIFPFSDVDLLLLYNPAVVDRLSETVEAVFYPLWDAGLEVGHSVRTVDECLTSAKEDFFFQVSLVDARFLAGEASLFATLQTRFRQEFIEGCRPQFIENMLAFRTKRHQNFGIQPYLLEPQIKENRGGFRDIQAMLWTAQMIFGLPDLAAMEEAGLLHNDERRLFEDAWDFLIRVRNRLHYLSTRKNDQLFFEHQEEIATAFDFKPADGLLAVERFMCELYRHMQTVAVTTDLFFEHVRETLSSLPTASPDRRLEPGIESRQGWLHLTDATQINKKPALLMRIFALSAKTGLPIHHRTKKLIKNSLHLIDSRWRRSKRLTRPFLDVLLHCGKSQHALNALLETGMLAAFIPEFAAVECLAQHDIYHVYTVDSHLMQTTAELHRLQTEESRIFSSITTPHILFLAGLLHDIGKGEGGAHADRGARIAGPIAVRLGLTPDEQDTLVFLIRDHLFLSSTALRRDLEDENFILRCADRIRNPERLAMLYLLSIADARATGPTVWNDWKGALLLELYLKIAHTLNRGDRLPPDRHDNIAWLRRQVGELLDNGSDLDPALLPEDYLLSFTPAMIVEHIKRRQALNKAELLLHAEEEKGHWALLILTKDRPGLLAKICGVLALHNLDVLAAQIFTWPDGTVVDQVEVIPTIEGNFTDQDWRGLEADLLAAINNRLGLAHRLHLKPAPLRRATPPAVARTRQKVLLDNDTSMESSIVEVFAAERPGLLYEITRTLADFGINIFRAKIAKEAEKVIAVFYVRNSDGSKIEDPALQEELRQGLLFLVAARPGRSTATLPFL